MIYRAVVLVLAFVLFSTADAQPARRALTAKARQLAGGVEAKRSARQEGAALRAARLPAPARAGRVVYTVTSAADTDDGTCTPEDCTFLEALNDASIDGEPAEIAFAIGGGGAHQTIRLTEELPVLDVPLVIDGDTQGCDRENGPCITFDGSALPTDGFDIFFVFGDGSEIRNLHFVGAGEPAYGEEDTFSAIDVLASDVVIEGCVIGSDRSGTTADPDGQTASGDETGFVFGVIVFSIPEEGLVSSGNRIGGPDADDRNVIIGNFIGVSIQGSPRNTVQNNLLSGNALFGLGFNYDADENVAVGNWVGLDASGTAALPNGGNGIQVDNLSTDNRVGGPDVADGNVVSGNLGSGIVVSAIEFYGPELAGPVSGTVVEGNYVGTDVEGLAAIPNGDGDDPESGAGIVLSTESGAGSVEGTVVRGNLVAGNLRAGVLLEGVGTTGAVVEGNLVGVGVDAETALPNGLVGLGARGGASGNRFGSAEAPNFVGYHLVGAAVADETTGIDVAGNAFLLNGLAIDLGLDGPTTNDAGDADEGPNRGLNAPVVLATSAAGGQLSVTVQFDAPAAAATYPVRVTVYDATPDAESGRELLLPLGFGTIRAADAGRPVTITINGSEDIGRVAVVATDAAGNTGEVSTARNAVALGEPGLEARDGLRLAGPNPFRTSLSIAFVPAADGPARVSVVDALGREVAVLLDGPVSAGAERALRLDGASLAPGVYVVRAVDGRQTAAVTAVRVR